MKTSTILLSSLVCAVGLFTSARSSAQSTITVNVTDPMSAIWDVSELAVLQTTTIEASHNNTSVHVDFASPFTQDGGGKLKGSGSTDVHVTISDPSGDTTVPTFTGTYRVNGSISSSRGIARMNFSATVTGTALIQDKSRKVSASKIYNAALDSAAKQVSGRFNDRASATGLGSVTEHGSLTPDFPPDLGNGTWTLVLNLDAPVGNKLTGDATLTLNSGKMVPFTVKGTSNPRTNTSKLVLKGVDAGQGSSLQVTLVSGNVSKITGRVSGQSVKFSQ